MLINTNHWIKSDRNNETIPLINDDSDIPKEFQPIWISLSLISSKLKSFLLVCFFSSEQMRDLFEMKD